MSRPRIGVACPIPGERAALLEWLDSSGYEPVPMLDIESVGRALDASGFEALVAAIELLQHPRASVLLRSLGTNRPLLIVGDEDRAAQAEANRRRATFLGRPVHRDLALLAVSLALAEGRPARRLHRRPVPRIPASLDGVESRIVDVSYDGLRLEVLEQHRTLLPPSFNVRVPMFRLQVVVQRVWVSTPSLAGGAPAANTVWCGVALRPGQRGALAAWQSFVDHAPSSARIEEVYDQVR